MAEMLTEDKARELAKDNLANVVKEVVLGDEFELADEATHYEGKVRDNFTAPDGKRRLPVTTDRVSAFDIVLGYIPFKGQVLEEMARDSFSKTEDIAPNHMLDTLSSNVSVVQQCDPIMVEMVVRQYLTGSSPTSIWTAYEEAQKEGKQLVFCGNPIRMDMIRHEILDEPIVTPTTKAGKGEHDKNITHEEAMARLPGSPSEQQALWYPLKDMSMTLFNRGTQLAAENDLILVDTKYELGRTPAGLVVFIDEIHTPDSSRYWWLSAYPDCMSRGDDPKSLDKEYLRKGLQQRFGYDPKKGGTPPPLPDDMKIEAATRYMMLCQTMTGRPFVPDTSPVEERVYRPLVDAGVLRKR
jgi:phosphoribosylaminoimidazole-succinocarboxamide synthase